MAKTTYTASFPSHANQLDLRQRCAISASNNKVIGYDLKKLSEGECWQWYAYDHAMHRIVTGDMLGGAPTDPKREWFNQRLVDLAETQFRRELNIPRAGAPPRDNGPTPAETAASRGDFDRARHFAAQDRERAAAQVAVTTRTNRDGSPTPQALDYVALCRRQIDANVQIFKDNNPDLKRKPTQVWDSFLDNLGVKTTENDQ